MKWLGDDRAEALEPEDGEGGENLALVRDRVRMDDVVGRDAVGGDEQQRVAEIVDLTDLASGDEGSSERGGHVGRC